MRGTQFLPPVVMINNVKPDINGNIVTYAPSNPPPYPVISVNDKTGAVNLLAKDVGALSGTDATLTRTGEAADAKKVGTELEQLKTNVNGVSSIISDAWSADKTYAAGDYCIYNNKLYKATEQTSAKPGNNSYWNPCNVTDEKVAYSDVLTLEEIQASSDLTNKVASAEAAKSIKYNVGSLTQSGFYTEKYNHGNTMPADYGGFVRISGYSWPKNFVNDTYYLGVASDGAVYSGTQINGAAQITWTAL